MINVTFKKKKEKENLKCEINYDYSLNNSPPEHTKLFKIGKQMPNKHCQKLYSTYLQISKKFPVSKFCVSTVITDAE